MWHARSRNLMLIFQSTLCNSCMLQTFVQSSNPYAQDYLMMHEVREFELGLACVEGHETLNVVICISTMVFPESNVYTQGKVQQIPPAAVVETWVCCI